MLVPIRIAVLLSSVETRCRNLTAVRHVDELCDTQALARRPSSIATRRMPLELTRIAQDQFELIGHPFAHLFKKNLTQAVQRLW